MEKIACTKVISNKFSMILSIDKLSRRCLQIPFTDMLVFFVNFDGQIKKMTGNFTTKYKKNDFAEYKKSHIIYSYHVFLIKLF